MKTKAELRKELDSFQGIWHGGYYQGDPANPIFGLFGINSFLGVSHVVYLSCIKPYVKADTTLLEIGCGRGAWTRLMLHAKKIYCIDALSAEHNKFYEYVGRHPHVAYWKVNDFSLSMIPEDSLNYVFSYDSLCHVSFDGISEYARNLYPRMKAGAHGFWMVADYQKYNKFASSLDETNVLNALLPRKKYPIVRKVGVFIFKQICKWNARRYNLRLLDPNEDDQPRPGRWYHAGTRRICDMLRQLRFDVVDEDMGIDYRSPIIHFRK